MSGGMGLGLRIGIADKRDCESRPKYRGSEPFI